MTFLSRSFHGLPPRAKFHSLPTKNVVNCSYHLHLHLNSPCKDINFLLQLHCRLIVLGLRHDNGSTTHLINSYSLFHKPDPARLVLDSNPNPSVVSWNSMIRAYTRADYHKEALSLYRCMLKKGVDPDKYTFTFALKACTGTLDFGEGLSIHRDIARAGLESDVYIGTGLVDMYCKMGDQKSAREVFDRIPYKDVVAWNAMIAGFSHSGDPREALAFFRGMQMSGVEVDFVSLLNLIPAISKLADVLVCRSIHGYVIRKGLTPVVYNGLIDMYCKCGDVYVARCIFERMAEQDSVSWGTMMSGYVHNGCFLEVLELFDRMKFENVKMNKVVLTSSVMAAAEMRDLEKGKMIHECIIQQGFDNDVLIATPIITMYVKFSELEKAKQLFQELPERDLVAWSAIIAACVQEEYFEEALYFFRSMQCECVRPNSVTLVSILPACTELSLRLGKSIHCYTIRANIFSDAATATALLSMYLKFGFFSHALVIFNMIQSKDVVAWNALINGYSQAGDAYSAMDMFCKLLSSGIKAVPGTMVGLLPACGLLNNLNQGSCIHGKIIKSGFDSDNHIKHALIDMYAKCGSLSSAVFLFKMTSFKKATISWNIMIAGYMQNGHAEEAISAFHQMKLENFRPNLVTIVSVLPAAAYLAALREGIAIHATIIQMGFQSYIVVGNNLVDMYAKCGLLSYSEKCFNEMENKDIVSWNAMLAGYAVHGLGDCAVSLFSLMQGRDVPVDSISFLNVLSACRHAGLIKEGRKIFDSMHEKYDLEPDLEHYACMVDLLGRAGLFDEMLDCIDMMPLKPDAGVWGALISSSRIHSNVQLGEVALDYLVKLEPRNPSHKLALLDLYAQYGKRNIADYPRSKFNTGIKKIPGCSWVQDKNRVHAFQVDDRSHPQVESINSILSVLHLEIESMGYFPGRSCDLENMEWQG